MITIAFFNYSIHIYYTCNIMDYLFVSLYNTVPPWVACYPGYYNTTAECFSLRQIDLCPTKDYSDEPCFPPKQKILAGVFFMQ